MYMCWYVCVLHICTYKCVHMCLCEYVCVCIDTNTYIVKYVLTYAYINLHTYIEVFACIHI